MVQRVRECGIVCRNATLVFFKALNMVDHSIVLAKLEHYGVKKEVLELLASYLRGKFQYVVYNRGESGRWVFECKVQQVLETLFLLIYVNDMTRASEVLSFTKG
jgi:hypothetical protein